MQISYPISETNVFSVKIDGKRGINLMHIVTVNNLKSDTAIIQENTRACFCVSNPTKLHIKLYVSFKCGFDTGRDNFGRVFTLLSLTQDECFNGQVLVNSQLGRWCGVRTQPPHWITVIVDTSK